MPLLKDEIIKHSLLLDTRLDWDGNVLFQLNLGLAE